MKNRFFTRLPAALLAGVLMIFAAACSASPAASSEPADAAAASVQGDLMTPTSDFKVGEATPEEMANSSLPETLLVGEDGVVNTQNSAAPTIQKELITMEQAESLAGDKVNVYRGIIMDFAVNDAGQTVWILAQDPGADYGEIYLNVAVTTELPTGSAGQQADIANGTHLEVFYTEMKTPEGGLTPEVSAVAVNVLLPSDMTTFNGKVTEVTPDPEKPGYGDFLLDPLFEGEKTVFHYTPETSFEGVSADAIKVGDELHILTNGISTRSLPPQSSALTVRPYVICESCPTVPKN